MKLIIGPNIDEKNVRLDFKASPSKPENIPSYTIKGNKAIKGTNGKGSFLVDGFIRDAIQFVCGFLITLLGKAIKSSNRKADIEASRSVLKDLERMRDKTEDEELKKYINNKIDVISGLLKQYDEEVMKR